MKDSIRGRLAQVQIRQEEIALLLSQPEVMADQNLFRDLSREYSQLEPVVKAWQAWQATLATMDEARRILADADPEMMSSLVAKFIADAQFRARQATVAAASGDLPALQYRHCNMSVTP